MTLNPLYNRCFTNQSDLPMAAAIVPRILDRFVDVAAEDALFDGKSYQVPLSQREVDFSVPTSKPERTWKDIALIIAKIIILPWGIYSLGRYLFQRFVMSIAFPAQSILWGRSISTADTDRKTAINNLKKHNYKVRDIVLEIDGIRYSGLMIGHKNTLHNGRWILAAAGNYGTIEDMAEYAADPSFEGRNIVMINGPGVIRSQGDAVPQTIGAAQRVGLLFLEKLGAKEITLWGFSFGGGAIGQAIMQHDFKNGIQYRVVFQMTFSRLSDITKEMVGSWAGHLIKWLDLEMDTVAAMKKLDEMNIPQVIVQAADYRQRYKAENWFAADEVIPAKASLGSMITPSTNRHIIYRYTTFPTTVRHSPEFSSNIFSDEDSAVFEARPSGTKSRHSDLNTPSKDISFNDLCFLWLLKTKILDESDLIESVSFRTFETSLLIASDNQDPYWILKIIYSPRFKKISIPRFLFEFMLVATKTGLPEVRRPILESIQKFSNEDIDLIFRWAAHFKFSDILKKIVETGRIEDVSIRSLNSCLETIKDEDVVYNAIFTLLQQDPGVAMVSFR